jgi:hypothetical protein
MIKIISILVALAVLMTLAGTASATQVGSANIMMDNFNDQNNAAAAAAAAAATSVFGDAAADADADAAPAVGQVSINDITVENACGVSIVEINQCISVDQDVTEFNDYYYPYW